MTSFTPGNWVGYDLGCSLSIRSEEEHNVVATISLSTGPRRETQYANAKLICAAPELLKAASALIEDVKRRHPGEQLKCRHMRCLEAAVQNAVFSNG